MSTHWGIIIILNDNNEISGIDTPREHIEKAREQLERGKEIFREIISPLAELSDTWNYRGITVLPNMESKEMLLKIGFTEQDIKVSYIYIYGVGI